VKVNGQLELSAEEEKVRRFLTDPDQFSQCLPGLRELQKEGDSFKASFKIDVSSAGISQLSNISSSMRFIIEQQKGEVTIRGQGKAVGMKVGIELRLRTMKIPSGTELRWEASLELGLLAKFFGEDTLRKITEDNVSELTSCMRSRLE